MGDLLNAGLPDEVLTQIALAQLLTEELRLCGIGVDELAVLDALACAGLVLAEAPEEDLIGSPVLSAFHSRADEEAEKWAPAERVYFIRSGDLIKIGFTKNLESRIRTLHLNGPGATLLLTYRGSRELEAALHRVFAMHRRHGEWFDLPRDWRREADEVAHAFGAVL